MAPTFAGDFHLRGKELRAQGLNRVGNMLVPNSNYCAFEDWVMPILNAMLAEQQQGTQWTPSKVYNPVMFHCAAVMELCCALCLSRKARATDNLGIEYQVECIIRVPVSVTLACTMYSCSLRLLPAYQH